MAVDLTGNPANASTVDTSSANPTATYPVQANGGTDYTCNTVYSDGGGLTFLDPLSTYTSVTGTPINPLVPPVPQPLVRNDLVSLVNSDERGVYIEGKLVPVIGDALSGIGATPDPRPLTSATDYPTIFIGTRT